MTIEQIKEIREACRILNEAQANVSWGQMPNRLELVKAFKSLKEIIK